MIEGSGKLLEAVFASSPDAVVIVDEEGCIDLASAAVETLFGYKPEELVGQPVETLVPDDVRAMHQGYRVRYATSPASRPMGAGLELHGRRRDGTVFAVDVSLSPLTFDGQQLTAAFVRDARDRRRSEHLMSYMNEITRHVLAGEEVVSVLELICRRTLTLAGARVTWVVLPDRDEPTRLRVAAASGDHSDLLVDATLDATASLSARAMDGGRAVVVPDMAEDPAVLSEARSLGLGPGVYFPMNTQDGPMGALVAARVAGEPVFRGRDQCGRGLRVRGGRRPGPG